MEKLGRFLLRGLRIGASTIAIIVLLRKDWSGGIRALVWLGWCFCRWSGVCRPLVRSKRTDSSISLVSAQMWAVSRGDLPYRSGLFGSPPLQKLAAMAVRSPPLILGLLRSSHASPAS